MLSTTPEKPPPPTPYAECGASERTLTFAPGSVRLSLADDTSIELHGGTWEYGFRNDDPLQLRFESLDSCTCTVNRGVVVMDGDGPHWVCKRPEGDDETYELRVSFDGASGQGLMSDVLKPSAAQPTLIIRTKRNCPTGVVTKPSMDE